MSTATAALPTERRKKAEWPAPLGLVPLSLIPVLGGMFRLTELTLGEPTPDSARFFDSPVPIVVHVVSAIVFSILGAFQFVPSLRRRRAWHRIAGRILVPAGLLTALAGMWMAVFYALPAYDGPLLLVFRLFFGSAMVASLLLGLVAVRRRNFSRHSEWMTRGYALGVAAGTQAIVLIPRVIFFAPDDQLAHALFMGSAWIINLGVAEFVIRRRRRASVRVPLMEAAVYRRFGGPEVIAVTRVPKPSPGPKELLIKVHASTVSIADHRVRSRNVPKGLFPLVAVAMGVFRPRAGRRILGMDAAGVVEAIGSDVTKFTPGDEVVAMLGEKFGAHAEYVCVPEHGVVTTKPRTMSFDEAVCLVFGGITTRGFLNMVDLEPGDTVLVNGASGAVGTAMVQVAKHLGAEVTGVSSGAKAELVASLGADRVIDYTKHDFTAAPTTYDVIVDCVGNAPFERVESIIKPGGALLLVIADLKGLLGAKRNSRRSGKTVVAGGGRFGAEDLAYLVGLAEAGHFRAVIDRSYDLAGVVEAHRYVDTGRKTGSVVLRMVPAAPVSRDSIRRESIAS